MSNKELLFSFTILKGFAFRGIFELFDKLMIKTLPIFFKEDGITILTRISKEDGKQVMTDTEIFGDDIIEYYLNTKYLEKQKKDDLPPFHIEQVKIEAISKQIKNVKKQSSIRLYKYIGGKKIFLETASAQGGQQQSSIDCLDYQKIPTNTHIYNESPNVKIQIDNFCAAMKNLSSGGINYVLFKVFKRGLAVEGKNDRDVCISKAAWGEISKTVEYDDSDSEDEAPMTPSKRDFYKIKIPISVIKAFQKLNSVLKNSIIKVYSNEDGYVCLQHKVDVFGEQRIYFQEKSEDNDSEEEYDDDDD